MLYRLCNSDQRFSIVSVQSLIKHLQPLPYHFDHNSYQPIQCTVYYILKIRKKSLKSRKTS